MKRNHPVGSICPNCGEPCRCRNGSMKCHCCGATGVVRCSFWVGDKEVSFAQYVEAARRMLGI